MQRMALLKSYRNKLSHAFKDEQDVMLLST